MKKGLSSQFGGALDDAGPAPVLYGDRSVTPDVRVKTASVEYVPRLRVEGESESQGAGWLGQVAVGIVVGLIVAKLQ